MTAPIAEIFDLVSGHGDVLALHDVSCRVESEKVTALLGSNGAGRTMFLKTVAGLITPRRGRIVFDGAEIGDAPSSPRVEQGIMLVPTGRMIFPDMTLRRIAHRRLHAARPRGSPKGSSRSIRCFRGCAKGSTRSAECFRAASSKCWRSGAI